MHTKLGGGGIRWRLFGGSNTVGQLFSIIGTLCCISREWDHTVRFKNLVENRFDPWTVIKNNKWSGKASNVSLSHNHYHGLTVKLHLQQLSGSQSPQNRWY